MNALATFPSTEVRPIRLLIVDDSQWIHEDFKKILTETDACLIKQYKALMKTEGLTLEFTDDAIDEIAKISFDVNETVENIGARRLLTVMERLLDDISFKASDMDGETMTIDADYVREHVADLAGSADLSKFIL